MRAFKGQVTHLRSTVITTTQSGNSSTRHETSIRFGNYSLNLETRESPAIHTGDELRVYGRESGGMVHAFLLRNQQNGYEAGFATLKSIVLSAILAGGMLAYGLASGNSTFIGLGALGLLVVGLFGSQRARAAAALKAI